MAGHDVFHHIRDSKSFEVPRFIAESGHIEIPQIFGEHFALTKFMVLETVALVLAILIFVPLAIKVRRGEPVRGAFWNFWESIVLFLRDELVRPLIGDGHHDDHGHDDHAHAGHANGDHGHPAPVAHGAHASVAQSEGGTGHGGGAVLAADGGGSVTASIDHLHAAQVVASHPADKYLPFILSAFFFILFNNLLGAIPFLGSATGNIWVTGVLAVTTLAYVIIVGTKELGVGGFWVNLVPSMGLSGPIKYPIVGLMWVIEFAGLLIKHGVLAVRLFANIMAGHTVIAVILGFIALAGNSPLFYVVAPASVLGQVGIGLLELFVAFLQAYVFAFLATLFIGAAVHPH